MPARDPAPRAAAGRQPQAGRPRDRYGSDVLTGDHRRRAAPPRQIPADVDEVFEEPGTGWAGAVVTTDHQTLTLEDRHGRRRVFPFGPGLLYEGRPAVVVRPRRAAPTRPARTASGSIAVPGARARVARAGRIWVEGRHDAELVERVWGDDLRIEGIVVEPLDGVDDLPARVAAFRPGPGRRLGVLVDHLVPGSKESRLAAAAAGPHVLVVGHPYVDVWQAVRPARLGLSSWPDVPRHIPWKDGACAALGVTSHPEGWRRVLAAVSSYADLETPLLGAVERLVDFVTADRDR